MISMSPNSTLEFAIAGLVRDTDVVVLDARAADAKVISRRDGALLRVLGRAGDGVGDFRVPLAIASLDSGRYVILDQGRRVLSVRDARDSMSAETHDLRGFYNGLVAFPERRRVVLSGTPFSSSAKGNDLHEFDYDGRRLASYASTPKAHSEWARRVNGVFAAAIGSDLVIGAMYSNELRIYDEPTGRIRTIAVAPNWFRPLEFPPDAALQRTEGGQPVAQRVATWLHTQRIMNGVFPLTRGRLLVRFMAFTSARDQAYYYAVADTTGRTYAVSRAIRANVIATRGDTVFWIRRLSEGRAQLGSGVLDADRLAASYSGTLRTAVAAR